MLPCAAQGSLLVLSLPSRGTDDRMCTPPLCLAPSRGSNSPSCCLSWASHLKENVCLLPLWSVSLTLGSPEVEKGQGSHFLRRDEGQESRWPPQRPPWGSSCPLATSPSLQPCCCVLPPLLLLLKNRLLAPVPGAGARLWRGGGEATCCGRLRLGPPRESPGLDHGPLREAAVGATDGNREASSLSGGMAVGSASPLGI